MRGLSITYAKYIGYSVTEPTEEFIQVLKDNGIEKPIDINRDGEIWFGGLGIGGAGGTGTDGNNGPVGVDGKPIKKKGSTRKYICSGGCGCSFRATKDLNVLCLDCGFEYVKEEN